ncbi:MAG: type II secretion system F family protein, partial [Gemmataceae bacterium]
MQPIVLLVFVIVVAVGGLLAFMLRGSGGNKAAASRLDILVGKKRTDSSQDILLKKAYEADRNRILEFVQGFMPNLPKFFEQADANIKPSSLVIIGLILGGIGLTGSWLAQVPWVFAPLTGLVLFSVPFIWLWNKRRVRLNSFAAQLCDALELIARALRAGHSLAAGMHVV